MVAKGVMARTGKGDKGGGKQGGMGTGKGKEGSLKTLRSIPGHFGRAAGTIEARTSGDSNAGGFPGPSAALQSCFWVQSASGKVTIQAMPVCTLRQLNILP